MDTIGNKDVKVLDVTLRDGSYVIDFQFTEQDTAIICSLLESAGIDWIEIGHGVGLNGSNKGYGTAACSDEEYIQAASENLKHAQWGTFFIPGIGTFDDIKMAASYKMPFIRVGTNITDFKKAIPYIELAKSLGMFVAYNGMKSYAVSPKSFASIATEANACGVDMICLVDSAGGLFPNDVEQYFKHTQDVTDIKIGFHGHDNLSLVMANTLKAIECGAYMVDTSIQGMGRSAGNARTEVLFAILKQKGLFQNIDLNRLIDIGQNFINPLIKNKGADPLAIISGYAMFHSSFTPKVSKYAKDYNIDIRDLIISLCEEDKIDAPDDLLTKLSNEQKQKQKQENKMVSIKLPQKERSQDILSSVEEICKKLKSHAIKFNKYAALNIVFDTRLTESLLISYNMQSNHDYICGAVTVKDEIAYKQILPIIDKYIDIALIDSDLYEFSENQTTIAKNILKNTIILTYSDQDTWVRAVEEQTVRLLGENLKDKHVVIFGNNYKAKYLSENVKRKNAKTLLIDTIEIIDTDKIKNADIIILWENADKFIKPILPFIEKDFYILDAELNSFSEEFLELINNNNHIKTLRVNIWPTLISTLSSIHEYYKIYKNTYGKLTIDGIHIVSGGYIGSYGDIIVDNINSPSKLIGMADGKGKVIYDYPKEIKSKISALENIISNKILNEQNN